LSRSGSEEVRLRPSVAAEASLTASAGAFVRAHSALLVVWTAMVGWSVTLFVIARSNYAEFRLGRYDLGNMVQAVWSTTQGRPLEATHATGEQLSRLAGHIDPILVLLAPLWVVAPSPLTLAAAQIAACAVGALPVFWLARRHLESERAAVLLAVTYLAYPWLAWTALDAIHPVTFAIPLLLYAIWFLDSDRLVPFAVCAGLVLATGELMGLPIAALGVWYWMSRGRRGPGLAIAAAGVGWTVLCLKLIVPAFRGEESPFYAHYDSVGGSPEGVIETLFTDPLAIVEAVTSVHDLIYLFWLAAPLVGAFLLAPWLAAAALPQLAANLLSERLTFVDPRGHYVAAVIPFLVAATVLGLARVAPERRTRVAAIVAALSAAFSLVLGPWPGWPSAPPTGPSQYRIPRSDARLEAMRNAVALVPVDAPVTSTNRLGSHLSARRYVYAVPTVERADWIVVDLKDPSIAAVPVGYHSPPQLRAFVRSIETSDDWRRVFSREDVRVYQRVGS
jgi:uncharacterized membrane protein